MKTLKRTFLLVAVAAMLMPLLDSCKKGKEDPGISFRSRNARVTGTWTLKSYEMSTTTDVTVVVTNEENDDDKTSHSKTTTSETYNGSSKLINNTFANDYLDVKMWYDAGNTKWKDQEIAGDSSGATTSTTTYSFTIALFTDNTYETTETSGNASGTWEYDWEIEWDDSNDPAENDADDKDDGDWSTTGSATSVTQGSWYWEDNTKKNKLFINAGPVRGQVIRLSNKEMWVEIQYAPLGGSGEATSNVGSDTDVKEVLLQKYNDNDPLDMTDDDQTTQTDWNNTETQVMWVFEKTDKNSKRHKAGDSE